MKISGVLIPLATTCSALQESPLFAEIEEMKDRVSDLSSYLLSSSDFSKNVAVSPLNVFSALKVLQDSTSGASRDELDAAFGTENGDLLESQISQYQGELFKLRMVNRIFYQKIDDESATDPADALQDFAEVFDFRNPLLNPLHINQFIEQKTKGKIVEAFPKPIDPDTFFLLISTLYYKASWATSFDHTTVCWKSSFLPCEDREGFIGTDFFNTFYDWKGERSFRIVELPLTMPKETQARFGPAEKTFSALQIWMPDNVLETEQDHREFLATMEAEKKTIAQEMSDSRLRLVVPKFSISTEVDLKDMFYQYNVTSILEPGHHLGPIYGEYDPITSLNEAKHVVQFDVDENGIEGAAVTAFSMMYRSFPTPFKIDRPFYFRLILKTEDVSMPENEVEIFSGRVTNP